MEKGRATKLAGLSVTLLMFLFGTVLSVEAGKGVDNNKKLIRFAAVGPLTGQYAMWGQYQKKGIEMWVKEVNDKGGIQEGKLKGYKIEVEFFDDKADPKESAMVAQKIVIGDYLAEIGPCNSSCANASAPIFERNNVSMILTYASDYRLTHSGFKNVFRIIVTTETESQFAAYCAITLLNKKSISEIYENSAYGQSLHDYFEKYVKEYGGQLVSSDTFVAGQDIDFKGILTKAREREPDIIMMNVSYNDAGLIVTQARSLGWKLPLLAAGACNFPKFIEMMPKEPGDVYMPMLFDADSTDPLIKEFVGKFKAAYREKPADASALGYDALQALTKAIELGAEKREEMREYLKNVEFKGLTTKIKFDENGDVLQPIYPLMKLSPEKKWVSYK